MLKLNSIIPKMYVYKSSKILSCFRRGIFYSLLIENMTLSSDIQSENCGRKPLSLRYGVIMISSPLSSWPYAGFGASAPLIHRKPPVHRPWTFPSWQYLPRGQGLHLSIDGSPTVFPAEVYVPGGQGCSYQEPSGQ